VRYTPGLEYRAFTYPLYYLLHGWPRQVIVEIVATGQEAIFEPAMPFG
jgi:hypothetical protein